MVRGFIFITVKFIQIKGGGINEHRGRILLLKMYASD